MTALICGSVAYDNIMVFEDSFKNHILPDKIHMLNVAFLVPKLRREFGGCATNIAYNLKLLGEEPLPMATVGQDYEPYRKRLKAARHQADAHPPARQHVHGAGVHHDGSLVEPDHRVPPGRDELFREEQSRRTPRT